MTHPAILKAQSLNDECPGEELEPNQEALIAAVNKINWRKTQAYRATNDVWSDVPRMYRSCLIAADDRARIDLDKALSDYNESLEYKFDEAMDAITAVLAEVQQAAE